MDVQDSKILKKVKEKLNVSIPKIFLEEIKKGKTALVKQFVPTENELHFFPEELEDPIADEHYSPVEGLTHRYPDRVLLKPTYLCGVYCRFCFRRYKVSKPKFNLSFEASKNAIQYIRSHPEIWEVILSGGDPLILKDAQLKQLLEELDSIDHVKVIRFHSRIPSVLPQRITPHLLEILKRLKKSIWIAVHINSAEEFTQNCKDALARLTEIGIPLLLQSVLLKDINDTEDKLVALLKTAIENRVKPYYLHYPDLAKGTAHFRIPLKKAILLVHGLRGKISGLCLPQFMVDLPNGKGKVMINTSSAVEVSENVWEFESPLDGNRYTVQYPKEHET